jgi:serine/threonine protein phosphatase PrpC
MQEDDGRGYYMAIVCDGMGGHNAGEVASAIAVETISAYLDGNFRKQNPRELLYHGFTARQHRISEFSARRTPTPRAWAAPA